MASTTESGKFLRKGGMGRITESTSPLRVEKGKGVKVGDVETEMMYIEMSTSLFKDFLLEKFDYLEAIQNPDKNFFQIPANTLSTEHIENMLATLDDFQLMAQGNMEQDVDSAISSDPFFRSKMKLFARVYGDDGARNIIHETISMFVQLREFLVVEYLNSLNSPVTEHIVHNLGFFINEVHDGFRVTIQLENWAGSEDSDGKIESFDQDNLGDIIDKIEDYELIDEKREVLRIILTSLMPLAKAIDFIRAPTMDKLVSENGETHVVEVRKVPFQHFDIKPSNIFSRILVNSNTGEEYLNLIIGDFGITLLPDQPRRQFVMGTEGYTAPELYDLTLSKDLTRADIYSFGVTLFEILVGHMPTVYNSQNNSGTPRTFLTFDDTDGIINADTNLVTTLADEQLLIERGIATPDNLDNVIQILAKAMSIDPRYRYSTCEEMISDLNNEIGLKTSVQEDLAA